MKIRVTAKNYPQEVLRSETPVLVEFFAVWCGKCAMMEDPQEVLRSETPVLVEFFAVWCGKCAMMEDVLDEIAKEYDGRVKVCQIEIEESAVLAAEFEVGIVPAFVVFRDGAKEYDGRVKVCQIEIEESAVLAAEFEVGIVPAFVVFRDGKPVNYANGVLAKDVLIRMLEI